MSFQFNYRTFSDLGKCIRQNIKKLPENYDLIVGIPRSGMIPAYMIALFLNKQVCSLDEFISGIRPSNGDRLISISTNQIKKILIVDDSIHSGFAQKKTRKKLSELQLENFDIDYLAIYARSESSDMVDFYFELLESPRVFQWNYMNSFLIKDSCFDIDGVLCVDPTEEENDDGEKYRKFLLNAKPLFIPSYEIYALVTSRLEKYRPETEEWLKNNGVKYKKLFMLDLPSKEERIRQKAHSTFKSKIYSELTETKIFYESNRSQAIKIAQTTGKPCFCVETDELFRGNDFEEFYIEQTNNPPTIKNKKILLYSHELTYTGAPHSLLRMAKIYLLQNCRVDLWTRLDGEFRREFEKIGIKVKVVPDGDVTLPHVMQEIAEYDLAVANTVISSKFYSVASKLVPTIWYIREALNLPSMVDSVPERLQTLKNADEIYCVSEFAQNFIRKTYNPHVKVVHNCIEDHYVESVNNVQGKINILLAGNIKHNKGFDIAIEAFNLLPQEYQKMMSLNFIGRCPDNAEEYYTRILQAIQDNPNMNYMGEITDESQKLQIFKDTNVVLVPSRSESCSLVTLEGAMMGKALIVTENVGAKYILTSLNGWIIPSEGVKELKDVFMQICEYPDSLINMGAESRKMYLKTSTIDRYERVIIETSIDYIERNKFKYSFFKEPNNLAEIRILKNQIKILNNELLSIRSSKCYKLSYVLSKIPRKIKGFFRCWQDHGFCYTVHRAFSQLRSFRRNVS